MGISYTALVFIIIAGAALSLVLAYAVWRLYWYNPRHETGSALNMSDEQKKHIRSVMNRNKRALIMESHYRV